MISVLLQGASVYVYIFSLVSYINVFKHDEKMRPGFLTSADGCDDAIGSEVSTTEPGSQFTQLHIHQPLLNYGN